MQNAARAKLPPARRRDDPSLRKAKGFHRNWLLCTLENTILIGGNALPGRTAAARRRSCTSSSASVPVLPALSLQKETSEDNSAPSVDRPPDWDGQSGEFWRAGRETSIRRGPRAAKRGQGGAAARCGLDGVRQFSRVVLLTPPWFDLLRANPRRQLDDTNLRARTSVASLPHPASFSLPPSQRSSSPFLFPLRTDFSLRRSAFTMLASLSLVALASLAAARPVFQMDAMLATVTQAVSLPNTTQTDNATWYLRELFLTWSASPEASELTRTCSALRKRPGWSVRSLLGGHGQGRRTPPRLLQRHRLRLDLLRRLRRHREPLQQPDRHLACCRRLRIPWPLLHVRRIMARGRR